MIFYDWAKVYKYSGGSSKRILSIIHTLVYPRMPRNRYDTRYKYRDIDFSGLSYLKHADYLFRKRKCWRDKDLAEYIGIASFRNFNDYKLYNKTTLHLTHCPVSQAQIEQNRLLRIENDEIHFMYEDYD